jgi:hypothetical protein
MAFFRCLFVAIFSQHYFGYFNLSVFGCFRLTLTPGIIVTPLAIDEFNGPRGDFYKNMFANCPAGRTGSTDEVANVAELLMSERGTFVTGSTILIDGGATASYFYGSLKPEK